MLPTCSARLLRNLPRTSCWSTFQCSTAPGNVLFTADQVQVAHARWTASGGLGNVRTTPILVKTAQEDGSRAGTPPAPLLSTRLAAVEREKLERYQQRYEEHSHGKGSPRSPTIAS